MIMAEAFYQENDDPDYKFSFSHYRGNPFVQDTIDNIFNKEKFTVIGQPITLARVLNTLNKNYDKSIGEYSIYTTDDKYLYFGDSPITVLFSKWKKSQPKWDLAKDLDGQELKVILLISKLLGYEK